MQKIQFDYFTGMEAEQYSFYRVPKVLFTESCFKALSCEAKVLYGLMLDRMSLSIKNRWLDSQKVYPGRSTDGVLVKLPLPCPLAGSPLKAVAFQFLPLIGIGLFLKNKLQTVFSLVDFGLASGECPASKLGAAAQLLNALAYTADVGVVVGKQIGGVRLAFVQVP